MPVTMDEFEKGRVEDPYASKILKFLESSPDKAFNVQEIVVGVRHIDDIEFVDLLKIGTALMILGFNRKIEGRFILNPSGMGDFYYRIIK
jgi:hypothetical protein